ncbi:transmembrane protein 256-like [Anneissia japonica]|uniref:transmembrane protein 256-like n=1 Tax=Anneissia japonica TaxID=1529436 RepID=UPI001425B33D|nr:transmembrane protein 256-like [Anneissia japonica]
MAVSSTRLFARLAGVSGASAIGFGTYGAHVLKNKEGKEHEMVAFDSANRYHFYHSIALLGVPMCRRPNLVGGLMVTGMTFFCGSMYYYAITSDATYIKLAPTGGVILLAAWIAMVL